MGKIKKILEKELGSTQSVEVYPVTSIEAVYDENNERLDNIINRKNKEIQKELKAEVTRASNAESNLRETINNLTEINENATSANIVTIDNIPNTSASNVQQALNELFKNAEEAVGYDDFENIKDRLSVAYDKAILQNGVIVSGSWPATTGFITAPLQVYKNDTVKITANYYIPIDTISIDNGDGTYITVATGNSSGDTLKWTASKDCKVVFSGNDWSIAEISLLRASKVDTKVNKLVCNKRIIEFNTEITL